MDKKEHNMNKEKSRQKPKPNQSKSTHGQKYGYSNVRERNVLKSEASSNTGGTSKFQSSDLPKKQTSRVQGGWNGNVPLLSKKAFDNKPSNEYNLSYKPDPVKTQIPKQSITRELTSSDFKENGKFILEDEHKEESSISYFPNLFTPDDSEFLLQQLLKEIGWKNKKVFVNNEYVDQPRQVAWFGPHPYSYSGMTLEANAEMPNCVKEIKKQVEDKLGITYNSVLLNHYKDGYSSVAWHSDDELSMGFAPKIASVSIGEERAFEIRETPLKTEQVADPRKLALSFQELVMNSTQSSNPPPVIKAKYTIILGQGSLLVMDGAMQRYWQHRVPKEKFITAPRVNLTFRNVISVAPRS